MERLPIEIVSSVQAQIETQIGWIDQLISEIANYPVEPMVGGGAVVGGLFTLNEYTNGREEQGLETGKLRKAGAFFVGALGGAVISTPLAIVINETLL